MSEITRQKMILERKVVIELQLMVEISSAAAGDVWESPLREAPRSRGSDSLEFSVQRRQLSWKIKREHSWLKIN